MAHLHIILPILYFKGLYVISLNNVFLSLKSVYILTNSAVHDESGSSLFV